MGPGDREPDEMPAECALGEGLWRTIFAGPGQGLGDVFANLERAPQIERIVRHPKRELIGARIALTPEEGEGYWDLTRIRDDLYVVVWNFVYKNPRFEIVPGDDLIQFNFRLTGDLTLGVSRAETLRLNRPSLLVWAQSRGVEVPEWTAPRARERMVVISVHPKYFMEHFVTSVSEMPPQLQAYLSNPIGQLNFCQLSLTAQMFEIANKLIENPFTGPLSLIYTEALTLELLCATVGSFVSLGENPKEYSERELHCLRAARALLMRQLNPSPTLRKVARSIGMAETSLTQGFKAVYGETILDFSLRCRMQHALKLLRDHQWTVGRVSDAVGYKHSTSFATAFRRHFGLRPVDVRRSKGS